ncbi:uncharacterized protein J3R85_018697 [Psidium guajava]|nr:uncharacterized protein J3R85_018697 [Psidium guajava]
MGSSSFVWPTMPPKVCSLFRFPLGKADHFFFYGNVRAWSCAIVGGGDF